MKPSLVSFGAALVAVVLAACVGAGAASQETPTVPPAPSVSASPTAPAPVVTASPPMPATIEPAGSAVAASGSMVVVPPATLVPPRPSVVPTPTTPRTPMPTPVATATPPPVLFATGVVGRALLGPTCPVMRIPPDPQCADKPVAGVGMAVQDSSGATIARGTTDSQGFFAIELPAGSYTLVPGSIPNAMHVAAPIEFSVSASGPPTRVDVSYDTGIR